MLQSQGFGSRKECVHFIKKGFVSLGGEVITDPNFYIDEPKGLEYEVSGKKWLYRERVFVVLNKPAGYECSRNPSDNESVFGLFPSQLSSRKLQSVGRLDVDTRGLLLFSDDGEFIHQFTSPKKAILKRYRVITKHPVSEVMLDKLRKGVELHHEEGLFTGYDIELYGEFEFEMSIDSGRYHQVKRMVASASNRVGSLQRVSIGSVTLESFGLPEGRWEYLTESELNELGWEA
jgi:16S rRNA pseudouridine516 synthase